VQGMGEEPLPRSGFPLHENGRKTAGRRWPLEQPSDHLTDGNDVRALPMHVRQRVDGIACHVCTPYTGTFQGCSP
jgi:hypothetical protein